MDLAFVINQIDKIIAEKRIRTNI